MHWFFHALPPAGHLIIPDEEEQRHIRALRLREDEQVTVTDGRGNLYRCNVVPLKRETHLHITEQTFEPASASQLTLAVAPTKNNDRLEWLVEKAVEMGIHRIIPIHCAHSERPVLKKERLLRVAIAAIKQSRKAYLPEITDIMDFHSLMSFRADKKLIAHCADDAEKKNMHAVLSGGESAIIAIGPEGDFSAEEIHTARQNGFIPVTLGTQRLRTETAGLAAVAFYSFIQQMP